MLECRAFGEVSWENIDKVDEVLRGISCEDTQRFETQHVVYKGKNESSESQTFHKKVQMKRSVPMTTYEESVYASLSSQGLSEWTLRVEGLPIRSSESEQYGLLIQEVTETSCLSPARALESICVSVFRLPEYYNFFLIGNEYQTRRDGILVTVKVSSIEKQLKSSSSDSSLCQSHRLVELISRSNQSGLKDVAKAVDSVLQYLAPWVVRTVF